MLSQSKVEASKTIFCKPTGGVTVATPFFSIQARISAHMLCFTVISVPHSDYGYIKSLWICIKLLRGLFGSLSTGYHYMDVERSRSVSVSFSHTPLHSLWEYAGNMSARLCVQDTFIPSGSVKKAQHGKKKNTSKKGPGAVFLADQSREVHV